jgi:mannose-6-phosphate isomerase-like protein (cupin superfamily)
MEQSMSKFEIPAISRPGEGEVIEAFGRNTIRVPSTETNGSMSILEVTLQPGEGTPMHIHEREDEAFRVLSGRVAFQCGDETFELAEGGLAVLPRGIPHKIACAGSVTATVMVILTPGGFEQFFQRAANNPQIDPQELAATFGAKFLAE